MAAGTEKYKFELDKLVERHGTLVLRHAFFYLKDKQRAEDACQEVFLKILKKQPRLEDIGSERAYLLRVTINVCKDYLKSAWNRKVQHLAEGFDAPAGAPGPEDAALESEKRKLLFDAVLNLSDIYKDVLLLFYYHDMSTAEIASVLSIPEVTVRTRLMRGRKKLSEALKGRV